MAATRGQNTSTVLSLCCPLKRCHKFVCSIGSLSFALWLRSKGVFSRFQEIFPFIASFGDDQERRLAIPQDVRDENLLAALLVPLGFADLFARVRPAISISDASEDGGAAGEAIEFVSAIDRKAGQLRQDFQSNGL